MISLIAILVHCLSWMCQRVNRMLQAPENGVIKPIPVVVRVHTFSPENGVIKPKPVPAVDRVHTFSPENGVIKPKPVPAVGRSARVKSREWGN